MMMTSTLEQIRAIRNKAPGTDVQDRPGKGIRGHDHQYEDGKVAHPVQSADWRGASGPQHELTAGAVDAAGLILGVPSRVR
ncbi:hypothetical protein [Arthrobacter zhaoguopingii]|uniref:hypothetical protein n=1 Tax=Arthrobacter zhaoguopingii TaxID=2681491 RepID=UPI0013596120|nr:hypothetical protein [Arthrobacter zhaoguopingii]